MTKHSEITEPSNSTKPVLSVVFIDDYGNLTKESESNYRVILDGSYSWCYVGKCWRFNIKEIFPKIPISYILSDVLLVK